MTPPAKILPCSIAPLGERELCPAGEELERRSHSFIVTRYFIKKISPKISKQMTDTEIRAWLSERERIFERYTFPSMMAQDKKNKTWLVLIEKSLVKLLPQSLQAGNRPAFVRIVEVESNGPSVFSFRRDVGDRIKAQLDQMRGDGIERPVVTVSRLDNDDALAHDFLSTLTRVAVHDAEQNQAQRIVTFPHGVQYLENKTLATYLSTNNHYLSSYHVGRFEPDALHALSFNHSLLFSNDQETLVLNTDLPMWVEIVHGGNVSNRFQSQLPLQNTEMIGGRFGSQYPTEAENDSLCLGVSPAGAAASVHPNVSKHLTGVVAEASREESEGIGLRSGHTAASCSPVITYERMLEVQARSKAMKPKDFLLAYAHILATEDLRTILDIGVHEGGSLKFWRELYGPNLKLYGLDIKPECAGFAPSPADKIFIGSQVDRELLDTVANVHGPFDVIIDDGSHQNPHMWATFNHLFKAVRPGGLYIVEDMFTSYWERYGGGLRRADSFVERCKAYVDTIYARFMGAKYSNHHKIKPGDIPMSGPVTDAIESIAFHRCGIVVFRKTLDAISSERQFHQQHAHEAASH